MNYFVRYVNMDVEIHFFLKEAKNINKKKENIIITQLKRKEILLILNSMTMHLFYHINHRVGDRSKGSLIAVLWHSSSALRYSQ